MPMYQTYGNCGVESSGQIINQASGANISEDALLGNAIDGRLRPGQCGAFAEDRQNILTANGVPSTTMPTTPDNIAMAMSRGQGVIVSVDAAPLCALQHCQDRATLPTWWALSMTTSTVLRHTLTILEADSTGNACLTTYSTMRRR